MKELYKKYRPTKLSMVFGQPSAVKMLRSMVETETIPHALLFTGASGCGKTTLARIMRKHVGCGIMDFAEYDCGQFRGIDMVRSISSQLGLSPMSGRSKIYYIDECHKLTSDGQAAMLKMLEDTPDHVYFFLSTTDPQKLSMPIRTRCTEIKVVAVPSKQMMELLQTVVGKEKAKVHISVLESIVDKSEGSARRALVLLHQVIGLDSTEDMQKALQKADSKAQAIQLARLLINPKPSFTECVKILRNLEDDPESIRRLVLGYASAVLKGNGPLAKRAFFLIDVFQNNFFDSGEAGLTAAVYACATAK